MARISIIVGFLILNIHFCIAQYPILELDDYVNYSHIERTMNRPTYSNIKGSPFLHENFIEGQIKLDNGRTYQGPLRYDIYSDEIEFKTTDGDIYAVRNPETIQFATLGDVNFNYFEPGEFKDVKGFYQLLIIGDYFLYKKYLVELKDPEAARPYVEAKPARFEIKDSKYYIMDADGFFTEIKNKKDLVLPGLNANKQESFIKSNKISHKDENDLIEFVNFLNQQ